VISEHQFQTPQPLSIFTEEFDLSVKMRLLSSKPPLQLTFLTLVEKKNELRANLRWPFLGASIQNPTRKPLPKAKRSTSLADGDVSAVFLGAT
jgi:hypothetical protein